MCPFKDGFAAAAPGSGVAGSAGQGGAGSAGLGAAGFDGDDAYQRSILATAPDGMVAIDSAGHILFFSAAATAMFGYDEADVRGRNVNLLMPQPDRDAHDGYIRRYLETGEARIIGIGRVLSAQRRDGSLFPIELAIGDAHTPQGRVFTGFVRDLTERQETERRLADLQSEVSHMSRVSAMGSLASALAHELNQPLTAIANYMEGARELLAAPDADRLAMVREAMGDAAAEAIRAGEIVRRLRDFIARGSTEKRVESLRKLVTEAIALALTGLGQNAVEMDIRLDASADRVLVDRIQIQQVLLNLIRNAIEAMQRSPRRRIQIRSAASDNKMVQLRLSDTGPGLSPDIAAHLFEPFRSSKAEGMGLGLSISRGLIEGHGGRLWAEPANGDGAVFHFTLMRAECEDD